MTSPRPVTPLWIDGTEAVFEARGRTLVSSGWKVLLQNDAAETDGDTEPENPVPAMKAGGKVLALSGAVLTKKTKPAPRFTDAALVRELEKRGIGRPSTYAAILDTIQARGYVAYEGRTGSAPAAQRSGRKSKPEFTSGETLSAKASAPQDAGPSVITAGKRFLVPTPLGEKVIDALAGRFSFADFDFTSGMEQALDDIASGKAEYKAVVFQAYDKLHGELAAFLKATGKSCPKCGKPMVHRVKPGKGGYDFWGCSGYPDCKEKL